MSFKVGDRVLIRGVDRAFIVSDAFDKTIVHVCVEDPVGSLFKVNRSALLFNTAENAVAEGWLPKTHQIQWRRCVGPDGNTCFQGASPYHDNGEPLMWCLRQKLVNDKIGWVLAHDEELLDPGHAHDWEEYLDDAKAKVQRAHDNILAEIAADAEDANAPNKKKTKDTEELYNMLFTRQQWEVILALALIAAQKVELPLNGPETPEQLKKDMLFEICHQIEHKLAYLDMLSKKHI